MCYWFTAWPEGKPTGDAKVSLKQGEIYFLISGRSQGVSLFPPGGRRRGGNWKGSTWKVSSEFRAHHRHTEKSPPFSIIGEENYTTAEGKKLSSFRGQTSVTKTSKIWSTLATDKVKDIMYHSELPQNPMSKHQSWVNRVKRHFAKFALGLRSRLAERLS